MNRFSALRFSSARRAASSALRFSSARRIASSALRFSSARRNSSFAALLLNVILQLCLSFCNLSFELCVFLQRDVRLRRFYVFLSETCHFICFHVFSSSARRATLPLYFFLSETCHFICFTFFFG